MVKRPAVRKICASSVIPVEASTTLMKFRLALKRTFSGGVWCSLSEKSYLEVSDHWEDPARERLGPYFGWLCTKIPGYPDTAFLKTMVHQRAVGVRPWVELERTDHPLAVDQRDGIEEDRLRGIVIGLLHE